MKSIVSTFVMLLLTSSGIAVAEELSIRSGLWRTTTTSMNTLMPDPVVTTNDICVEGNTFDPETMVSEMEDCQLLTQSVSSNTMNYEMACTAEGGSAKITGQYAVNGDDGEGKMNMHMKMGPMIMEVDVVWESTYLGACE